MTNDPIAEILKGELTAYYTYEELPKSWDEATMIVEIPRMANESASRLKRRAGVNNIKIEELTAYIDLLQNQSTQHPLFTMIHNMYTPDWTKQENLPVFKMLMLHISQNLKS